MFEFMHKYRLPILIVMFIGLIGFGVWAAIQQLFLGPSNELLGTFAMPGEEERVEVWSEDYGALWTTFARNGDQYWKSIAQRFGLQETDFGLFIWDFIVLSRAAQAAGIQVTAADVERNLRMSAGLPEDEDLNLGDEFIEFQSQVLAIGQFRNQFLMQDPGGTPFADLLAEYKREYSTVKAKLVLFEKRDSETFALDLGKEEDKKKLQEWFDKNRWVATTNKKNESVDAEVVYVRLLEQGIEALKTAFETNWAELTKDMTVSEEDLQARYKTSTFAYQQLAHEEMAKAGIEHTHGEGDTDEDYDYLKMTGHLEREVKVARLMHALYSEVKEKPETLLSVAKEKYKFSTAPLKDEDRTGLAEQVDFGSLRLSAMVWETGVAKLPKEGAEPQEGDYKLGDILVDPNQPAGGLEAEVFDDPGTMIGLVRLLAHKEEREPEFEEILVEAKKEWQKVQARDDLNDQVKQFQTAVDDWILALPELEEKVKEAKKRRDEKIEEEIGDQALDRENAEHKEKIEQIEERQHHFMKVDLADDMKAHYQKAFEAVAKDKNLVPLDLGPVDKVSGVLPQFPEELPRQERINRFLRSKSLLNSLSFLEVGAMTTMPVDAAGLATAALLMEKAEPDASELLTHPDRAREIAARKRIQPDRNWNYKVMKSKTFFDLDAPETDKRIADAEAADRDRARRRAERQARRNKARQDALKKQLEAQKKAAGGNEDDPAKKPEDGDKKPGEDDKAGDGSKKPGDGAKKPGDGTKKPGDGTKKPGDGTKKPGDGAKKPGGN